MNVFFRCNAAHGRIVHFFTGDISHSTHFFSCVVVYLLYQLKMCDFCSRCIIMILNCKNCTILRAFVFLLGSRAPAGTDAAPHFRIIILNINGNILCHVLYCFCWIVFTIADERASCHRCAVCNFSIKTKKNCVVSLQLLLFVYFFFFCFCSYYYLF